MLDFNLKRRLTDQAGFILPTAVIVLLIITVLIGAAITVSAQTSTSTTRDDNSKAELEAAEAGLQVASYRLGKLNPEKTQCINGSANKTTESECKSSPESFGNGATFQYWTTLPLEAGAKCAGTSIKAEANVTQRCVTSEGIVNEVKPGVRLQTLLKTSPGESLFPAKGIIGLTKAGLTGNMEISAALASNGEIGMTGNFTQSGGCESGPSGSWKITGNGSPCEPWTHRSAAEGNITLAAVTPGESAKSMASGICTFAYPPKENCDYRLTNGIHKLKKEAYSEPYDPVTEASIISFEPTHREFSETGNAKLKLEGGVYNFCKFTVTGNLTLEASPKTEIFIDAPESERPGSKCPAGSGKFEFTGNLGNANNMLIYVYGKGPVNVTGNSVTEATIYAPEAPVKFTGNVNQPFSGGIAGKTVEITGNFSFKWNEEDASLKGSAAVQTGYTRQAWEQCTPGTGASEGC